MGMKFSFKKEPRLTGLMSVGHPYPNTEIKHNKRVVGTIYGPCYSSPPGWQVALMVEGDDRNPNCSWRWIFVKQRFDAEPDARAWLQVNGDLFLKKYTLHHHKD